MRIISGKFGRRTLYAVPGRQTRPTTDKIKEAIFNIITPYIKSDGIVLDLYAGSGGLGIEAVSRGMKQAFLIDHQFNAIKTIKRNVAVTKHEESFKVIKSDAERFLNELNQQKNIKFDLVLLDPPYAQQKIENVMQLLDKNNLLNNQALVVAETSDQVNLNKCFNGFNLLKYKHYGITHIYVYRYDGIGE